MDQLKKLSLILITVLFSATLFLFPAPSSESSDLEKARKGLNELIEKTQPPRLKKFLENAKNAVQEAQKATEEGKEKEAKKAKKEALTWILHAAMECADPGEIPGHIGEALSKEKFFSESGLSRLKTLFDALKKAKEKRKKSDMPIVISYAIKNIYLALEFLIKHGADGFYPKMVFKWYINAAANCDDIQDLINDLLDYLKDHSDLSGIPDISKEGCEEVKKMVDKFFQMKTDKVPDDELIRFAEEIKKFLDEELKRNGKKRLDYYRKEAESVSQESRVITTPIALSEGTLVGTVLSPSKTPLGNTPVCITTPENKVITSHAGPDGTFGLPVPDGKTMKVSIPGTTIEQTLKVILPDQVKFPTRPPEFVQSGSSFNLSGNFSGCRFVKESTSQTFEIPAAKTISADGATAVTAFPVDQDIQPGKGKWVIPDDIVTNQEPDTYEGHIYSVIDARLDQNKLYSGEKTKAEYRFDFSPDMADQTAWVRIYIIGPISVLGETGPRPITFDNNGKAELRFDVQAKKVAPGAKIPFAIILVFNKKNPDEIEADR